jgi:hypothetical protein
VALTNFSVVVVQSECEVWNSIKNRGCGFTERASLRGTYKLDKSIGTIAETDVKQVRTFRSLSALNNRDRERVLTYAQGRGGPWVLSDFSRNRSFLWPTRDANWNEYHTFRSMIRFNIRDDQRAAHSAMFVNSSEISIADKNPNDNTFVASLTLFASGSITVLSRGIGIAERGGAEQRPFAGRSQSRTSVDARTTLCPLALIAQRAMSYRRFLSSAAGIVRRPDWIPSPQLKYTLREIDPQSVRPSGWAPPMGGYENIPFRVCS